MYSLHIDKDVDMNIVHVEDHPLFSDGLERLLSNRFPGLTLTQVSSPESLLDITNHDVDLVIFDVYLRKMNGIQMMRRIRANKASIPVAFLSSSEKLMDVKQCIEEGAMGFIPKSLENEEILEAINNILDGKKFLTKKHQKAILSESNCSSIMEKYAISPKQVDVLRAMSDGLSNADIADRIGVRESTVKYHIGILFQSFCVKNRVECLRYAEKIGLIYEENI